MLLFSLVGLSLLFIGISLAYLVNNDNSAWKSIDIPNFFWLSTLLIIISSFVIEKAFKKFFKEENKHYKLWLLSALLLGVLFCITQILGWTQLNSANVSLQNNMPSSYLYLISGLHLIHVLVGIIALVWFTVITVKKTKNSLISFIYFTDPTQKLRLELLRIYWHFIDLLWLYLIAFFILNKLIFR